jgi:hypothetical protein|tara:strand:- start:80 stop:280 length:201 start_codon:yes stop_codon:yes gene_type:complete
MATIIDKPNNIKINKTNLDFKTDVDSMDLDALDFSNPSEIKAWAIKVKALIIKMKSMIEHSYVRES